MAQLKLIPTGKLDKDTDLNAIREGDYSDARNIIVATGKNGGKDTIKILESIKQLGITQTTGTFKAAFLNSDNVIYALYRTDSTNAAIYKYPATLDSKTLVVTYAHAASTDFTPDFKIIGNTLVWNYHGVGSLLYWDTTRTNGSTVTVADLLLAKSAPINVLGVTKTITGGSGSDYLELNDFQFASRYKYDTGEFSVLGNFSQMFKGEKDTASYSVAFTLTGKPTYAIELEVYVKRTEVGTWTRIHTADISGGTATTLVWKGDTYETLPSVDSDLPFSAVPVNVKNIEIADNRVFVADFEDDYANDATGTLAITVNNGYTVATGGTINNYFGADTTDAGIKSSENGTYYKPFANNSPYTAGVAFMDAAMKTRGVEYLKTFNTGIFAAPYQPTFSIAQTGDAKPTWAKWMQLVITKNLVKGRIFEGFANSLYFELEIEETDPVTSATTKVVRQKLSITNEDIQKLKYAVLDVSGMFKAGLIYGFNPGDRITLNCPDNTVATTDGDGSETGTYRKIDMEVKSSNGDKIFLEWTGGACLNDGVPDATLLYFEIYSPKQQTEEDKLFFYGAGPLIDISAGIPSTVTDYTIGDMVFKKFEMNTYTDQLLYKGLTRSVPAVIDTDASTIFKSTKSSGDTNTLVTASVSNSTTPLSQKKAIAFTGFGASNEDAATIVATMPQITGFYDSRCLLTLAYDFTITRTIGVNTNLGTVRFLIYASLAKIPYDPVLNTYGVETPIGVRQEIHRSENSSATLNDSSATFSTSSIQFLFENVASILSSGDKLKVYFECSVGCSENTISGVSLLLKEKTGVTDSVTLTLLGDRIAPVNSYSARTSVATSADKVPFVVRAMNHNNSMQWSSSGGKVFVKARDKFSPRRTNAVRHSGNMVYGTEVNNISMFSPLDTVEVPQENGAIMSLQRASRLQGEGDMLLAVCRNESSYMLLGETSSAQSDNSSFAALTSNIIGSVRNLGEKTGIQDKASIYNHNGDIYWWDNFRNIVVEFTKRGGLILTKNDPDKKFLPNVDSYFANKSGVAKFAFDPFYNLLLVNIGGTDCIAFSKSDRDWKAEYDIDFDGALHYGERAIYFDGGYLYRSLENASGNKVGEFFGTAYDAYIKMTANTITPILPLSVRVDHSMNVINYSNANYVKSGLMDINITNENGQETNIKEVNFLLEDNVLYAHVLRDINSTGGIISGRHIRGAKNNFKLTLKDNTQENRIFGLEITFDKVSGHS